MRNIEREVGNALDRTVKVFRSIDRVLDFRGSMPMERFLQHVRGGTVKSIRVTAGNRVQYSSIAAGWGAASMSDGFSLITAYHSFGESSIYQEKSNEYHVERQRNEVSKKEMKMFEEQNVLTAQKRVEELQRLFPKIEVFLAIPGEKDLMRRINELQQKGIEPFAVKPLET